MRPAQRVADFRVRLVAQAVENRRGQVAGQDGAVLRIGRVLVRRAVDQAAAAVTLAYRRRFAVEVEGGSRLRRSQKVVSLPPLVVVGQNRTVVEPMQAAFNLLQERAARVDAAGRQIGGEAELGTEQVGRRG